MHGNFTEFGNIIYRVWEDVANKSGANAFILADLLTETVFCLILIFCKI